MEFFSEHFEELLFDVICHFVTFTCSKKKVSKIRMSWRHQQEH